MPEGDTLFRTATTLHAALAGRPLLRVEDPLAKLEELFALRDPLYREVADVVIDTSSGGVGSLVRRVEQEIRKQCEP